MLSQLLLFALASAASSAMPASAAAPSSAATPAVNVPVVYRAGRIIAEPRTAKGQPLHFWVDTGGGGGAGMYLLTDAAVKRLGLATEQVQLGKHHGTLSALPNYAPGAGLPPPVGSYARAIVMPAKGLHGPGDSFRYDGMLGAGYLPGNPAHPEREWTFDYPGARLILQGSDWHPAADAHATPLHFPVDSNGRRETGFARIVAQVDGKPLSLLLDTGATGYPTPAAMAAEGGKATVRATSFITTSQLERWHKTHPDWRLIENADRLRIKGKTMRAIEVPSIEVAGWQTGPVWFTERPDANFRDFMSSMMDSQVEGALGGNAFRHFVLTVDYGQAKTWFRCVRGCRASGGTGEQR